MTPSIWTGMYSGIPLDQAIAALSSHGWATFEISTEHLVRIDSSDRESARRQIDSALQAAVRLSATMPQAHAYLQADLASPDDVARERDIAVLARHLALCAELGVSVVVMPPGVYDAGSDRETVERVHRQNVDALRRLGETAASLGLRIGLENLMRPPVSDPGALLALIDEVGGDVFGVTLDTSHANVMGIDTPAAIRAIGSRLIATHISDNDGSGDQHRTPATDRPHALLAPFSQRPA